MATYHFTVKPDRRPNGKRIQGVQHVDYINRENEYEDVDERRAAKHFGENFIHGLEQKNVLDGNESALLYTSPYGKIETNRKGLQISDNPSPETLAIALMISKHAMGDTVVVEGSDQFKKRCVYAAALAKLDIRFADESMQSDFEKRLEEQENERQRYLAGGGKLRRADSLPKPDADEPRAQGVEAPTVKSAPSLSQLSKRTLDGAGQKDAPVLVQGDARDELDDEGAGGPPPVRRDFRWGRRRAAVKTARGILVNLLKHKKQFVALSHVKYINREEAFEKRGGCVYKGWQLPSWAKDKDGNPSPRVFFAAADAYTDDPRYTRYREIEFSLPNELTLEQNKELIRNFLEQNLKDHYYAYAIHDKIGTLSGNTRNLHVHIMLSPRLIDDVERTKERGKSFYFKRALHKNAKDQSQKNRRKHGAPVDTDWNDQAYISVLRKSFEQIQNKALEDAGLDIRVDHRSLADQRKAALQEGDEFLAKLLDRLPEQHIRSIALMEENNVEAKSLRILRRQKMEYLDLLYAAYMNDQTANEMRIEEEHAAAQEKATDLKNSQAYEDAGDEDGSLIHELKKEFMDAILEVEEKKAAVIFTKEAKDMAIREHLPPEVRDKWDELQTLLEETRGWKTFLKTYEMPENATAEQQEVARKLHEYMEEKLEKQESRIKELQEVTNAAVQKLSQDKVMNGKIKKYVQSILFRNRRQMDEYRKANERLMQATEALQDAVFEEEIREDKKPSFSAKELYAIMRKKYYGWKKEYEKRKALCEKAKKSVISLERALQMAENSYTGGAEKELREVERDIRDWTKYHENDVQKLTDLERAFQELPKPNPWDSEEVNAYNAKSQEVADARKKAEGSKTKLLELSARQKELQERIQSLLATPDAQTKIQEIADGILRKNQPKRQAYEALVGKMNVAKQKMLHAKDQMNVARKLAAKESPKARYKKMDRGGGSHESGGGSGGGSSPLDRKVPSDIMDAIMGDAKLGPLVGRIESEKNNGLDDYRLLSDIARDAKDMENFMREVFS